MTEIKDCRRCGEDALHIKITSNQHFVSVRRSSKCKNYKPGHCERTCKTEIYDSEGQAVAVWNDRFGKKE